MEMGGAGKCCQNGLFSFFSFARKKKAMERQANRGRQCDTKKHWVLNYLPRLRLQHKQTHHYTDFLGVLLALQS
jgi:hypothetical protein